MLLIISIGILIQLTAVGNTSILLSGWIGVVVLDAVLDIVLWLKWIVRVLAYRLHLSSWIRLLRSLRRLLLITSSIVSHYL